MMRLAIFVGGLLLAIGFVGCQREPSPVSMAHAFPLLDSSDVACIVLGDDRNDVVLTEKKHAGTTVKWFPFNEWCRITNRHEIAELVSELNVLRGRRDGRPTLSGTLSMQVFVSRNGGVLAVATIICSDSTVIVDQDAETRENGMVVLRSPSDKARASGSQKAYGRKILQIMRARCPAEVEWREKECKEMGQTIEEYMGLVEPAKAAETK